MTAGRPARYTRKQRFAIEVMFLHGLPASRIAKLMHRYGTPMNRDQVWGQIKNMGHRRISMSLDERQKALDELRENPPVEIPSEFYRAK